MATHVRATLILSVLAFSSACTESPSTQPAGPQQRRDAVFANGGFETGSLSGWAVAPFLNNGIIYPPTSRSSLQLQSGGTNKSRIVVGPAETIVPAGLTSAVSLRVPKYGTNTAVVNELGASRNVNALSQQFAVSAADVDPSDAKIHVRFALAPVLNNGGHPADQQPYFWVTLTNVTKGATMFGTFNFAAQPGVPWKTEGLNLYTDWQSFDISPGNVALAIGDVVGLEVIAAGCSQGGHWGEVYVDGFGAFLPGLSVTATAPQSANAGSDLGYTLGYQNRGDGPSTNTLVTFNLPADVSYQSLSAPGASCTAPAVGAASGQVVCNVGTVNPSASGSFVVTVQINAGATGKISAGNYSVSADGVSPLLGPLVETTISDGVQYVDLATSISDSIAAIGWSQPYSFSITVSNLGAATAIAAPVDWTASAQLTSIAWTCAGNSGASCGAVSGSGSISDAATVPPGGFVIYSVTASVIAGSGTGSMSNLVTVTVPAGVQDNNSTNNQAIDVNSIGTLRTLTLTKSGPGAGRLITSPAAIDCGSACSGASTSFLDGTTIGVTATAGSAQTFSGWSGPCTGTANPCVFTITGDVSLGATFDLAPLIIAASAGSNGTISPSGNVSVTAGGNQTFSVVPSSGYVVSDLTVDGVSAGAVASFTFTNVTAPHTIAATFALPTFTLTALAGPNGTLTPSGVTIVAAGDAASFSFSPDAGYRVDDVLVDGVSMGPITSYAFSAVAADHTLGVSFILIDAPPVLVVTPGTTVWTEEGSPIAVDPTLALSDSDGPNLAGAQVAFSAGYVVDEDRLAFANQNGISGAFDGVTGILTLTGSASASQYEAALRTVAYQNLVSGTPSLGGRQVTFSLGALGPAGTRALQVEALPLFMLSASAGSNGTITPSGVQAVKLGHSADYLLSSAPHFHLADLLVDGASVGPQQAYTFGNVTAAHSIEGSFAIDTCSVTASAAANGSISCPATVIWGASASCTITPDEGYELVSLLENGVESVTSVVGGSLNLTVTSDQLLIALFKKVRGGACGGAAECGSGQCVDGVCCNTACTGQCEACAQPGAKGTCSPVSGAPAGGRMACASDGSVCSGSCNGITTATCTYPTGATACRGASCAAGVETFAASCDGAGACPGTQSNACSPFICGATACAMTCAADAQCSGGFFCEGSVCVAKGVAGGTCARGGECGSGNCVDGYCCNSGCNGQCEACDVAGQEGVCTASSGVPHRDRAACDNDGTACGGACDGVTRNNCAYPDSATACRGAACSNDTATLAAGCDSAGACPSVQTQACGAFSCGASACLGNCVADADCTSGNMCSGGVCSLKIVAGSSCSGDHQCGSGFCTDGVCCNSSCDGQCEACNVGGLAGVCSPVSGAPRPGRPDCASDQSVCGGRCDGALRTACSFPQGNTQCRAPACGAGIGTLAAACDGQGRCPNEQTVACTNFICGTTACLGNCGSDSECAPGNWCAAAFCVPRLALAVACGGNNQCGSGQCVDGVCCGTSCNGQCAACDVPGSVGTCTPVQGSPHGARTACETDGSKCGGQCDGVETAACAYSASECRGASCAAGTATLAASCSGGQCPAIQEQSCGTLVCGASACKGDCSADADCSSGNYCAAGVCIPLKIAAGTCSSDTQCGTGHCVDGVCCNTACGGQCEACDVPGTVGSCVAAVGAPHRARTQCASDNSSCAGACDGTSRSSCSYPAASVTCVVASCTQGVETHAASCNGAGQCQTPDTALCANFSCGSIACNTSCTTDTQCDGAAFCVASRCQAKGDHAQWKVQGGVGGCSSTGTAASAWVMALALVVLVGARRRALARSSVVVLALAAVGTSRAQSAQTGASRTFLLERFAPQAGTGDVLGVQSAQISAHLSPNLLAVVSYANMPLRAVAVGDDGISRSLAVNQTTITALASVGIYDRLELALAIPMVLTSSAGAQAVDPALAGTVSPMALADLRLSAKVRLFNAGAFGFALSVPVTLPSGAREAYAGYVGVTANPIAIAQWQGPRRSALIANAGVALRPSQQLLNLSVGNAFTYGVAGRVDLIPANNLAVLLSVAGEVGFAGATAAQSPLEALLALRWMPIHGLAITLGAGPGITTGYGTPRFRLFAAIGWVPGEALTAAPAGPPAQPGSGSGSGSGSTSAVMEKSSTR